ncbi:ribonuclease H-like domain-containing protein, partial [Tanacetum coccineum]
MFVHNSKHNSLINSDQDDDVYDPVTRLSKLDISDPLHLHPNDTTALTIVSIKLKGTGNYQLWSCAMLLVLEGKNKIGFIDGSCKISNTDEVLGKQWDRVNAIILGWILNSISKELFLGTTQHLTYTDKELDNFLDIFHLKIKLGRPNGAEAYISKIGNLKLSNGLTLYDVMVLPEYCVTLISVHKLIKENKHDWHYRLGHPADPVLKRVANDLNKDKSDSSSSSVSGSNINTVDFPVDSGNDADSSDDLVATQNEEVATLEENVFSKEPKTYFEASKYSHWTNAMNQEIDALLRDGTWELVDLHEGRKAIGSKWIYKIKFRSS